MLFSNYSVKQWLNIKFLRSGAFVILPLLLLLPACSTTAQLTKLQNTPDPDGAYHRELTVLYRDFAQQEARDYDWKSSQRFANKGLAVAQGATVAPENPQDWKLPQPAKAEIEEAHTALLGALASKAATKPADAARAQFYYDCWVEEQEENWQNQAIRACREHFFTAMNNLGEGQNLARRATEATIATASAPSLPPVPAHAPSAPVETASYLIPFSMAASAISSTAEAALRRLASLLKGNNNKEYVVIINGHTDRVGDARVNYRLAEQRAESVRQTLAKMGVDKQHMQVYSFGETDPRIPTEDNKAEASNRRVEIYVTGPQQLAAAY